MIILYYIYTRGLHYLGKEDFVMFFHLRFICQCAQKVKMSGYQYFGLQFYGECWATKLDEKEIEKLTSSNDCIDGTYKECKGFQCAGNKHAAYIYIQF